MHSLLTCIRGLLITEILSLIRAVYREMHHQAVYAKSKGRRKFYVMAHGAPRPRNITGAF
eukprot:6207159-Pleurochrysis_carterae.AAC.1